MAGKDLNYRITVDQAAGSAGIRDFSRTVTTELRKVDQSLTDTGTAAGRAAALMNQMAADAEAELGQAARAADALAAALGPEMAAKLGQNGIAQALGDLNKMGVSFNDVEAEADQLAAAIKRIDQVQTSAVDQGLGNVSGKLREIGDNGEQSRSVLANMAGNSMQSVTGGMGDLSMALGQVAEYATEGNISLKNLAGVAGPMAALAAATQLFSEAQASRADSARVAAEETERLTDAYKSGADPARKYAESLNEVGKVEVQLDTNKTADEVGGLTSIFFKVAPILRVAAEGLGLFGKATEDIAPTLAKAGASTEDWSKAIVNGQKGYGDFATALSHTTLTADEQATVLEGLADAQDKSAEAKANAANFETVFGAATADSTEKIMTQREAMLAASIAERGRVDTLDAAADAADKAARDTAKLEGATLRAENAARQMDQAWSTLTGKLDAEQAIANIASDFDDMREKGLIAWDETVRGTKDATAAQQDYDQSVRTAKQNVTDLGREIGLSIPDVKKMLLQIDDGAIDDVERRLTIMSRNRTMSLSIQTSGGTGYNPNSGYAGIGPSMMPPPAAPVGPEAFGGGVGAVPAAPAAAPQVADIVFPVTVVPAGAGNVTVDMRGAILGSRYDITRLVRGAVRDGIRLGGVRGTRP